MSEEKDIIDALGSVGETLMYRGFEYEAGTTSEAASEITRLRGEAEAREVEITALVESAREAQQLYVQADNEAHRLRGEVERLSREGDATEAAERDVGRYLYNRLEALVYAGVKCPEMDWIARVIESVEEYGASHCGSDELAPFPALSSAPKPEEG